MKRIDYHFKVTISIKLKDTYVSQTWRVRLSVSACGHEKAVSSPGVLHGFDRNLVSCIHSDVRRSASLLKFLGSFDPVHFGTEIRAATEQSVASSFEEKKHNSQHTLHALSLNPAMIEANVGAMQVRKM